jgi:hypothetical protein
VVQDNHSLAAPNPEHSLGSHEHLVLRVQSA